MSRKEKRGAVGGRTLREERKQELNDNIKAIRKALEKFKNEGLPIIKTKIAEESNVSYSTVNRSPHKELIEEYIEKQRLELSTNSKIGLSIVLSENKKLKGQLSELKEKYERLRDEINYSKELYE